MTPATRRQVLKYGIAIDLVILATGIGMLIPGASPAALLAMFIGAVALSAWKGGWGGALTAMALGAVALSYLFDGVYGSRLIAFEAGSLAATAIITTATQTRRRARMATAPQTSIDVFVDPAEAERERRESHERTRALERAAAEQLEAQQREAAARRAAEKAEAKKSKGDRLAAAREAKKKAAEEKRAAKTRALDEKRAAERRAMEEEANRKLETERAAMARQLEERLAREREAERLAAEEALKEQIARERETIRRQMEEQLERQREAERLAAERETQQKLEEERERLRRDAEERVAKEREEVLRRQASAVEASVAAAPVAPAPVAATPVAPAPVAPAPALPLTPDASSASKPPSKPATTTTAKKAAAAVSIGAAVSAVVATVTSVFRRRAPKAGTVNLRTKKVAGNDTANRKRTLKPPPPPAPRRAPSTVKERNPRLLLLEKRRGTADTAVPRLKQKGVEVQVVERWIDAVDELFRFRPDALFVDSELPDFEKVYKSISDNHGNVPIFITGRNSHTFSAPPSIRYAAFVIRPYEPDTIVDIARKAMREPESLLAQMQLPRVSAQQPKPVAAPKPQPAPPPKPAPRPAAASSPSISIPLSAPPAPPQKPQSAAHTTVGANAVAFHVVPAPEPIKPPTPDSDAYEVVCFSCRVSFDATDSDWCSCLTKERTLVCTNCLNCFCKAPPAYKEKFWVEAPPRLFERKTADARRQQGGLPENPQPGEVTRPLVLSVEDDDDIQLIVERVCRNLGYGFIYATNGQDGLELARLYKPNLVLSDAFMPKLDGREMCRMLKEEAPGSDLKTVVMTGLYTDTKYRSEALKRFHVDDYLAKPVAVTDLINLLQRHLEGVTGLPVQEDLHELHRKAVEQEEMETDVSLAELLESEAAAEQALAAAPEPPPIVRMKEKEKPKSDAYEVCCFNCNNLFDATHADWCTCLGRDQTLVCEHCGGCFCKSPSVYKERFWMDAPPSLFERKMIGSKRSVAAMPVPEPHELKRPLILLVEDDENIQLIVRTVVTSMGYGFIVAANGQEGLALAREYNPDLILSDAFMPKLDGREMCRLLKEDPTTARVKAIIMTGLYTDRKYRNEALDYFKVDDYVAKPLAVDDLIKLFKKHLPQEVQATM